MEPMRDVMMATCADKESAAFATSECSLPRCRKVGGHARSELGAGALQQSFAARAGSDPTAPSMTSLRLAHGWHGHRKDATPPR
jgi:hypothetical protein